MDEFKKPELLPAAPPKLAESVEGTTDASLAAEQIQTTEQICPYKEPSWSALPHAHQAYKFEVLKSGQIIGEVKELQLQSNWKFGRLPSNDIEMAHPTISRFHAVLQFRPRPPRENEDDSEQNAKPPARAEGWYIYDLNSTHGTFLNKLRIPPRVFVRMHVGHMLRLGASTRCFILAGPPEDEEPESELSVTELREQKQQQKAEAAAKAEAMRQAEIEAETKKSNEGVSWGMGEDADEETDLTHNPYATTNNEELFLDDPKKTLRGYFEREDLPLEYKCDELSTGSFVCRVELPIDDANGRPIIAEVVHKGRKKDCVVQCALEACRILDRHGVLRQANQEPQKRKLKRNSDSDEDEFLDRTGDVERKRLRKANVSGSVTLTYEDLLKQEEELKAKLQEVELNIGKYLEAQERLKAERKRQAEEGDDLDNFMSNLSDDKIQQDKTGIRKLRLEEQRIKTEQQKLQRLLKIAKPIELPTLTANDATIEKKSDTQQLLGAAKRLPMIGKRNQFSKFKVAKLPVVPPTPDLPSDEEEVEEDDPPPKEEGPQVQQINAEPVAIDDPNSNNTQAAQTTESTTADIRAINHTTAATDGAQDTGISPTSDNAMLKAEPAIDANEDHQLDSSNKKRRQRQRLRHKRVDADLSELDEHETSEKYAKWVPPENQTGDGFTELNAKYGY